MKQVRWLLPMGLLAGIAVALLVSSGASQPQPTPKKTLFSTLKLGQSVTLTEKGSAWDIGTVDDEAPLTHRVVEVGDDYIVLRDEAGSVETRLPATAIRAVVHVRTRQK